MIVLSESISSFTIEKLVKIAYLLFKRSTPSLMRANMRRFYQEADAALTGTGKHDEWAKFLAAVHTKLGDAGVTNQVNMFVNATTSRTFYRHSVRHDIRSGYSG